MTPKELSDKEAAFLAQARREMTGAKPVGAPAPKVAPPPAPATVKPPSPAPEPPAPAPPVVRVAVDPGLILEQARDEAAQRRARVRKMWVAAFVAVAAVSFLWAAAGLFRLLR